MKNLQISQESFHELQQLFQTQVKNITLGSSSGVRNQDGNKPTSVKFNNLYIVLKSLGICVFQKSFVEVTS